MKKKSDQLFPSMKFLHSLSSISFLVAQRRWWKNAVGKLRANQPRFSSSLCVTVTACIIGFLSSCTEHIHPRWSTAVVARDWTGRSNIMTGKCMEILSEVFLRFGYTHRSHDSLSRRFFLKRFNEPIQLTLRGVNIPVEKDFRFNYRSAFVQRFKSVYTFRQAIALKRCLTECEICWPNDLMKNQKDLKCQQRYLRRTTNVQWTFSFVCRWSLSESCMIGIVTDETDPGCATYRVNVFVSTHHMSI